eukprot:RCo000192
MRTRKTGVDCSLQRFGLCYALCVTPSLVVFHPTPHFRAFFCEAALDFSPLRFHCPLSPRHVLAPRGVSYLDVFFPFLTVVLVLLRVIVCNCLQSSRVHMGVPCMFFTLCGFLVLRNALAFCCLETNCMNWLLYAFRLQDCLCELLNQKKKK